MQTIPQSENEERIPVTVRIPKSLDRSVERVTTELDSTKQQFIEEAIREKLEREAA